jgi:peptidoglycan L-alanyl-D-glutamate endopeptidase CwlK
MINSKDTKLLHPYVLYLHDLCWQKWQAAGLHPTDTSTLRDKEYQDYLYAQGRTTKGSICTYTKGGYSMHNYGLAWDTSFPNNAEYKKAAAIAKALGLTWGGDFKVKGKPFVDRPHYQWTGGLTTAQLLAGKRPVNPLDKMKGVIDMFADINKVSQWARPSVDRMEKLGIIKGDEKNNFYPQGTMTREQLAVVIDRMLRYLGR